MIYTATFGLAGVNSTNNVIVNLKAGATRRVRVVAVELFVEAVETNAPLLLLQRMNAVGTGTITSTAGVGYDSAEGTAECVLETAWVTTKPTLNATAILKRFQATNTIGSGISWDFCNRPIILPAAGGLCVVQSNASGATLGQIGGSVTWDE